MAKIIFNVMKILINALSGNGDALMFSPALKLLKTKIPAARIDMLVMFKSVKEMYSESPCLDNIYHINFLKQSKFKSIKEVLSLRKNKYDYSINIYPSNRTEYNLVNLFEGAKKRISHHYLHTNFTRLEFLNSILVSEVKDRHNVLQNIDLIKPIVKVKDGEAGGMEIFISPADKAKAAEWIKENGLQNKVLIGFHPGSSTIKNHINKRWDKYKYAELGKILIRLYNAEILLFGNEFELNNEIISHMDGRGVIASTDNYMDSIARMQYCRLFVSNDTAFMHSAAALQLPTVAVFAYTNHNELYPWNTAHIVIRHDLVCSPCFYNSPRPVKCLWTGEAEFKCIKGITVDEVLNACRILIQEIPNDSES